MVINQDDELAKVEALERRLLNPSTRSSRKDLDELIADDFVEIGRSGRKWTKAEILESLPQEASFDIRMNSVHARQIGNNVILVTYRTRRIGESESADALRSSIWQRRDERWQIIFHQGTPTCR